MSSGVLIVGAGGLGAPVLRILHEAGVRDVTVLDPDRVALENLHRQILYRDADVGRSKALLVRERLGYDSHAIRLDAANGEEWVAGRRSVFDGTDNFADKYRLNDLCLQADVPLVHAGAAAFRGQVLVVRRGGPCLRCLLETPPSSATDECRTTGIFGPAAGLVAALAAAELLAILAGEPRPKGLLLADLGSGRLRRAALERRPECICGLPGFSDAGFAPVRYPERAPRKS